MVTTTPASRRTTREVASPAVLTNMAAPAKTFSVPGARHNVVVPKLISVVKARGQDMPWMTKMLDWWPSTVMKPATFCGSCTSRVAWNSIWTVVESGMKSTTPLVVTRKKRGISWYG